MLAGRCIGMDIASFTALIAQRVRWSHEGHELKFPDQAEKWDFDREVALSFGQRHVSVLPFLSFPARFRGNGFL